MKTNLGRSKEDVTLENLSRYYLKYYHWSSLTSADFQNGELVEFETGLTPDFKSIITRDSYTIGAVNYFLKAVERDSTDHLSYYELGKAYSQLSQLTLRSSPYDKAISYLDKSIQLKTDFEEAYLLKANIHEKRGIWLGIIRSEPHAVSVNVFDIKQALDCLDKLLVINPDHVEGKRYLGELKERYGKRYRLLLNNTK